MTSSAINAQDGEAVICPHCGGPTNVGDLDAIEVAYCIAGPDQDGCGWYEAPPGAAITWRTGRKVGRTIYEQVGPEPSDDDRLIGVMDTPDLARRAVEAVNQNELPVAEHWGVDP